MYRYKGFLLLILFFLIISVSSCTYKREVDISKDSSKKQTMQTEEPESFERKESVSVPDEYAETLDDYKNLLEFRFSNNFWEEYEAGNIISLNKKLEKDLNKVIPSSDGEMVNLSLNWWYMFGEIDSLLEEGDVGSFGYILNDVNFDGIYELFWVDEKYNILAAFTIVDGESELLDAFWPRYRCVITENGEYYTRGSGGASNVYYEIKELDQNNATFIMKKKFGLDGIQTINGSSPKQIYFEVINGVKVTITKERFEELLKQYPFEFTQDWYNSPIIKLKQTQGT